MPWPTSPGALAEARMRLADRRRPWLHMRGVGADERGDKVVLHALLTGYGPGLHEMDIRIQADVALPPHGSMLADAFFSSRLRRSVDEALAPHMARQDARRLRATGLGSDAPLRMTPAGDAAATPEPIAIDHLLIDRHVLGLQTAAVLASSADPVPGARGMPPLWHLRRQLAFDTASAHDTLAGPPADGVDARGMNVVRGTQSRIIEMRRPGGVDALLLPTHALRGRTPATFDGQILSILAALPQTVVEAAVGRPLGALLATGTPIDGRTILAGATSDKATALRVEPDPVRIGGIPAALTSAAILAMPSA